MKPSLVYFTLSGNQTSLVPILFNKELIRESLIVRQYSIKEETLGACHFRQAFTNPNFGSNIPCPRSHQNAKNAVLLTLVLLY